MCVTYVPGIVDGAFVQTLDRRTVIEDAAIGLAGLMTMSRAEATITDRSKARILKAMSSRENWRLELVRE